MADEGEEPRRVLQYPQDSNSYKILDEIGIGECTIVYKAECIPMNSAFVAIKSIDLDQCGANLSDIRRQTETASLLSHSNLLNIHCSFTVDQHYWIVMPFMSAGSLQSIMSYFPVALSEQCMAIILRETLKALIYLHEQGHVYKDIKAANILIDSDGLVKLDLSADFSISSLFVKSKSSHTASSSSSLKLKDDGYWIAPEIIPYNNGDGYNMEADIWSFGILALELAYRRPPLCQLPTSKSMIMRINRRFWFCDYENTENNEPMEFSRAFKKMVASCLNQDPSKRPLAGELLNQTFFRYCEVWEPFEVKNLFQELPRVEESFKETKRLRLKSLSNNFETDEDGEGYSERQNECYEWKFNQERFKLEFQIANMVRDESTDSSSEGEENDEGGRNGISGGGGGGGGERSGTWKVGDGDKWEVGDGEGVGEAEEQDLGDGEGVGECQRKEHGGDERDGGNGYYGGGCGGDSGASD